MHTVVVIPTYNERHNISMLVHAIAAQYPRIYMLVVDDSSSDGTADEVRTLQTRYSQLELYVRPEKQGLGAAYKDVLSKLAGRNDIDAVVTMDADGSHNPKYIKEMLLQLESHDYVIGARYTETGGTQDWELWRQMLSKFGNLYARALTGLRVTDVTAGFTAMRHSLLKQIDFSKLSAAGYAYQIESKYYCIKKLGTSWVEIPIVFESRREGESKISHQIISEGIVAPIRIFMNRMRDS